MMATKHPVRDTDLHFVINPANRSIIKQYEGKAHIMQYDQNSERLTFDVPRYIEEHDMSECDVIQVHYENISNGTSSSTRQSYRGVEVIDHESVVVDDEIISFSWLIPSNATTFAGTLKFQLKFVCHDTEYPSVVVYRWHTNVNSDISIVSGLAYTEEALPPEVTATLKSLEIEEEYDSKGIYKGVHIILDGITYTVYNGGYSPEALDIVELNENKVASIDEESTDIQYPSARAVYEHAIKPFNNYAIKHNIKTYTSLEQLGLLDGATMSEVVNALPPGSALSMYILTNANPNLVPSATNGWLEVTRSMVSHALFTYTTTSRKMYIATALNIGNTDETNGESISDWISISNEGFSVVGHTHTIDEISGGTFTDKVMANGTATTSVADAQIRNIKAGTADMTAGESELPTGELYFVYE